MDGRATQDRAALRAHLVEHRIAGDVATPREANLDKYARFVAGAPNSDFGLVPRRAWDEASVLALMARRCGVSADPDYRSGPDRIDPDLTIDALDRLAARLARAAERRERVMLATGHPAALLAVELRFARLLGNAGCTIVEPSANMRFEIPSHPRHPWLDVSFIGGVGVVAHRADLVHTHRSQPIELVLAALTSAHERWPDLVIADHGWAGGAAQAGIDAIGFADSNDPALFVGEEEGIVDITVPLDDGVAPRHYSALVDHVAAGAGL
jgi:hypothetical protein